MGCPLFWLVCSYGFVSSVQRKKNTRFIQYRKLKKIHLKKTYLKNTFNEVWGSCAKKREHWRPILVLLYALHVYPYIQVPIWPYYPIHAILWAKPKQALNSNFSFTSKWEEWTKCFIIYYFTMHLIYPIRFYDVALGVSGFITGQPYLLLSAYSLWWGWIHHIQLKP